MDKLTYDVCAPLLKKLGYAPAAVSPGALVPIGPWPVLQLDYSQFATPNDLAAVLCALPAADSDAPHIIKDHTSTRLAAIVVHTGAHSAEYAAIVERIGRAPVRVAADGSRTYIFRTSDRPERSTSDNALRVYQSCIVLDGSWPNGALLDVPRNKLPELTAERVVEVFTAADALASKNAPPFVPYQPPPKPAPASIRLERGSHEQVIQALTENGYVPCGLSWGDEPSRSAMRRGEVVGPPAVGIYLKPPRVRDYRFSGLPQAAEQRSAWLVSVTVKAPSTLAPDVERIVRDHIGDARAVVRDNADRSTTWLFAHDVSAGDPFNAMTLRRSKREQGSMMDVLGTQAHINVESKERAVVVLGPDGSWRDGVSPVTVRRGELPEIDRDRAGLLLRDVERYMAEPQTPPTIVERAKRIVGRK